MFASIFLYLIAFLGGIFSASGHSLPNIFWLFVGLLSLSFLSRRWRLPLLLSAVCCLGAWRAGNIPAADLFLSPYFGRPASDWNFRVCADPEPAWDKQIAILCPLAPSFPPSVEGKILVNLPLYPRVYYGDYLFLNCRLEKPPVFTDFDYAAFLAARGIGAVCSWPKVLNLKKKESRHDIISSLFTGKRKVLQKINQSLPEPAAGLAAALLLGYKKTLFPAENLLWQKAGLSHLIAISGGHISLFLGLIISLFIYLGCNKRHALWPALLLAGVYVLLTGVQASALRSLLMGGIILYAWRRGRLSSAWGPLLLAAVIMLWQNPDLWRQDLGFQLSFLAVAGMIAFYPLFYNFFEYYFHSRFLRPLFEAFSLSLSAQLLVWPLLAWKSGGVSIIAPLTNVLAFSVFGPLMFSLLLALSFDFIFTYINFVWLPANLLLDYLLGLARLAAAIPGAYLETPNFKLSYVVIYYFLLLLFFVWRQGRTRRSRQKNKDIKKDS